ncbi:hypothetical protein AAY473_021355 [Plecturocebus cupreus]
MMLINKTVDTLYVNSSHCISLFPVEYSVTFSPICFIPYFKIPGCKLTRKLAPSPRAAGPLMATLSPSTRLRRASPAWACSCHDN